MAQNAPEPSPKRPEPRTEGKSSGETASMGEVPGDLAALREATLAWRNGPVAKSSAKMPPRLAGSPANTRSPAASTARSTAASRGRCACSPASAAPRRPTPATSTCWSQGNMGLSVAFDLPTLMGYDTDAPQSARRVRQVRRGHQQPGRHGDPVRRHPAGQGDDQHDHQQPGGHHLGHVHRRGREAGVPMDKLGGTLQNDILKEYHRPEGVHLPAEPSMRLVTDTIEFGTRDMPLWNTISISGYHIREAGSTAAQELAFTLGDGSSTCAGRWRAGWTSTSSPRASLLLQLPQRLLRGDRQVPRRPPHLGARDARDVRRKNPRSWLPLPHPDGRACR
jgi:hypothetical protein